MHAASGRYLGGKVVLDAAPEWPEGMEVRVTPSQSPEAAMMTEDEQGEEPDEIARWSADFLAMPALSMTSEEEQSLGNWRSRMKEFNRAAMRRLMDEEHP